MECKPASTLKSLLVRHGCQKVRDHVFFFSSFFVFFLIACFWSERKSYISLDQELGDFCLWVVPTRKEIDLREETITRLNLLVNQTFGGDRYITCHNFGSWQLQLALPGSDLDFVLMGGGEQAFNPLRKMASSLRNKRYASSMNVIENTRVPIIKYTDIKTNIDCDISFDMEGGILMGACFSKILGERKMIHARKLV